MIQLKHLCISLFFASRPKTLVAGLCPVAVGTCYAFYLAGRLDVFSFTILIISSVSIQIATNFFNDALDSDHGRDSKKRLGPSRAAATGALTSGFLKRAAFFLLFVAFVLGLILAFKVGFWVFLIGLPALALAYFYTGSKFSLSMTGTADLFVVIYFGVIPVWATTYILAEQSSLDAALSGLQLGLFANALLLINNLRDFEEDSLNGKKTLIVRYGRNFGLCFLAVCSLSPYFINFLIDPIFFRSKLWSLPFMVVSLFILYKVCKNGPSARYNAYLGMTALNLLFFTYFFSLGILSS